MQSAARRLLVAVLTASLVVPWSAAAEARAFVARPREFWRLPRARWRHTAEARKVQQLLAQGQANLDNAEPAAAEKQFAAVLRLEPCNVTALIGRGNALRCLDKPDAALSYFQTALRLDPKNAVAFSGRGRVRSNQKDFDGALADCTEAIRLSPASSEAYRNRGCIYDNHHQPEKAIADFDRAIMLSPQNAWVYYDRAYVRWNMKQLDQAISDASQAIKLAPKVATFLRTRACVWTAKSEYGKANADINQAIRLKPTEAEFYVVRGELHSWLNDPDSAITDATRATELDAKSAVATSLRGRAYCKKGDLDRGIVDLTNAIRLDPKFAEAYYCRCVAFAARHELDKALADADEAIRLDPSVANSYRLRGTIYKAKGNESHAKSDFFRCRDVALQALLHELDLEPKGKQESLTDSALELRIRHEVESLKYDASVQQSTVELVRSWNLPALKRQLEVSVSDWKSHKCSTLQLMEVQQKVAEKLARMISTVIWSGDTITDGHDLTEVVRDKIGCCQGKALLYYVLGNAVGLSVEGLDVDLMAGGPSSDGSVHVACVVKLCDDSTIMVDATKQVGHDGFVSQCFRLKDDFRPLGTYWELKDKSNPRGLHQVIQIVDASGLVALVDLSRALALLKKTELSGAKSQCVESLRLNSRSAVAHHALGQVYMKLGKYRDAIASFSDGIARDPSYGAGYAGRGWCYDKLCKTDLAIADFNKALSLNPKLTFALTSRCGCYLAAGNLLQAMEDANTALKSNQSDAGVYQLRAEIWARMAGHESELIASSRRTSQQRATARPDYPFKSPLSDDPPVNAEQNATAWKHMDDLIKPALASTPSASYEGATQVDEPKHFTAMKEDYKHVVADLDQVLSLDPNATWALSARGAVYAYLEEFDKSIADSSEAIRRDPKNVKFYDVRRAVYEMQGDFDKAILDQTDIIRLQPKSPDAYSVRANLYARKHDMDKAEADYREAERLKPSDNRYR
jgi:tetratricopeptide (TPR) repeat protein